MEYIPVRVSDIIRQVNHDIYLPAIQREFVWDTRRIERLFDSIMADFPIGSFLYWRLEQKNKDEWPIYEFIRDFDGESPHNPPTNMSGIMKDITLVLDGQQRITSLFIGLRGSYRFFYYHWRTTNLYLNVLKPPVPNEENPKELTYGFAFREDAEPEGSEPQFWYPVGRVLDFEDAEDAKSDVRAQLARLTDDQRENANKLIGRLHSRIVGNYYEEKSQTMTKSYRSLSEQTLQDSLLSILTFYSRLPPRSGKRSMLAKKFMISQIRSMRSAMDIVLVKTSC